MIYFIRDTLTDHVKIGFSVDPWRRFAKIQSDCPGQLEMAALTDGGKTEEAALHQRFAAHRLRGEWFRESGDLASLIASIGAPARPAYPNSLKRWGQSRLTDADIAALTGLDRATCNRIRNRLISASLPAAIKIVKATGQTYEDLVATRETATQRARREAA